MNSMNLKASVSFVGDGSTNRFYFGFDYINKQFVKVQVGAGSSPLTYLTDYTVDDRSVTLTDTPAVGVAIRVYRETPSDRIVEWADGAFIKASQMTLENLQQLHLIEEAQDYPILNSLNRYPDGVNFNALGSRIINVSDPTDPQDVVTKHYMENVQGGFIAENTKILNEAKDTLSATQQTQSKAQTNETLSKAWATSTESPDNEEDTQSSTGKTQSSRSWALYSEGKAQESATSEAHAKTSETNAKVSETNAKTSETKALTSEQNAKVSETNAKTSETNAKTSETRASASASSSASSASASATSANNAKTSETNAANSAKQAAESAGVFQDFQGATASADGMAGKVPKPLAGQQDKVLKADGTWGDGVTPKTLWNGIYYYKMNYVPSDLSNEGWANLGFCSIYYGGKNIINNQPEPYGQLINMPIRGVQEIAQIWISQNSGRIMSRGGNQNNSINDRPFQKYATGIEVNQAIENAVSLNMSSILDTLLPVGTVYMTENANFDPNSSWGVGVWVKTAVDRVLQGTNDKRKVGTTIDAGLPNITGKSPSSALGWLGWNQSGSSGALSSKVDAVQNRVPYQQQVSTNEWGDISVNIDASKSNPIYGSSDTVQPPAELVFIWKRIS